MSRRAHGVVWSHSGLPMQRLTRRCIFAGAASALLLAGLSRGATAQSGTPVATDSWSFTDDHGTTIALERRPERIVAHIGSAATLWDYGIRPVGVFGPTVREDGRPDPLIGNVDLEEVTSLGAGWDDLDLEELVALQPDLVIGTTYSPAIAGDLWALEPEVAAQVAHVAPIVAISVFETSVTESLARFEDLVASFGADLDAPKIAMARERFGLASEAAREAASAKPGLHVLVMSAWPEAIYVANPPRRPT